jgi:hypothetical protein
MAAMAGMPGMVLPLKAAVAGAAQQQFAPMMLPGNSTPMMMMPGAPAGMLQQMQMMPGVGMMPRPAGAVAPVQPLAPASAALRPVQPVAPVPAAAAANDVADNPVFQAMLAGLLGSSGNGPASGAAASGQS